MLTVVDFGSGNIQAFINIYKHLNISCHVARNANELTGADKIILPGVGSFDWAMRRLNESGLRAKLDDLVVNKSCHVLGICVGMQMMANSSEEGKLPGLGWINAEVKRFNKNLSTQKIYLPHMGWNDVEGISHQLFKGLKDPRFYFLHSYYLVPHNPLQTLAVTHYHKTFVSAVYNGNIYGVQFHPEKSHRWGVQLLKNFAAL